LHSLFHAQFAETSFLNYYDFYFCSIGQFVGSESWHSNIDVPVSVLLYMFQLAMPFHFSYFLAGSFFLSGRLSLTLKRMSGQFQVFVGCG